METFTFDGICKITFRIDATKFASTSSSGPHKEIILHAKELLFQSAEYQVVDGDSVAAAAVVCSSKAEEIIVNVKETTVKFVFGQAIPTSAMENNNKLVLAIVYKGFLNNQMAGFYRSSYTDMDGQTKIMASTQFEALDARRAFPCVDEPAAKAIFQVTMTIPSHLTCFSNMPELSRASLSRTKTCLRFMETPKMSTYLLAFCVGEFDFVQQKTAHGVLIRVYTPVGKSTSGLFALDCACRCLDAYDDFFHIPYPLPKLDMVAIPEFAMGAMENWGLVTYREVDLLIDPLRASSRQKQRVASVVAHELAHQWFGNLVTMDWWSGLWLNESFASWTENWATDKLYPDYKMWDQFVTGHLASALRMDALRSSHPIDVPIRHAEEVNQVFDAISYCKGASVVRMIKAVLGMKHFQSGLQHYMKDYAYGNTDSEDLWNAWEQVSGIPVGQLMSSWTLQMGFPLLRVVNENWTDQHVTIEIEQEWFLADGSPLDEEEKAKMWTIPIMTCTDTGPQTEMTLMREKSASITVPIENGDKSWVKLNAGQEVPMRVLPSLTMLKRYGQNINTMKPMDRAGLINDSYALVKAGHLAPENLIQLLGSFKNETEYVVWEGLASVLSGLDTVMSDDEYLSREFRVFGKKLVVEIMNKVGWEPQETDGHLTTLLRGLIIGLLSSFAYDDASVVQEASKRFHAFRENHSDIMSLPSDIRTQVFQIVLKNGGAEEYEYIKSYYFTAPDNAERKHVLSSLGYVQDAKLKTATLEFTTSGAVKLQDFFYAIGSVSQSSREARELAWLFFQNNFERIKGMVSSASSSLMDACIVYSCGLFCSTEKADEVAAFFASHPLPNNTRKIDQTLEQLRANARFLTQLKTSELSKDSFWETMHTL